MYGRTRREITHDNSDYAFSHESSFITICIIKKLCLLGKVFDNKAVLTDIGRVVEDSILYMNQKQENLNVRCYVIMPNHIHMVLDYCNADKEASISDIIRDFKSYTTMAYNKPHGKSGIPLWQRGYYDHRIRNDEEMRIITDYITNNPERWATDKFYVT